MSYVHIFKQEGTSRSERYPDTLDPGNIAVDSRRLEDFIIYAQRYTRNILFTATGNNPASSIQTWDAFFKDNSVLLAAYIATVDIDEVRKNYQDLSDQFRNESTRQRFSSILDFVLSRFKKIDQWYASSRTSSAVNEDIYLYIRSLLVREWAKLQSIIAYFNTLSEAENQLTALNTTLINQNGVWNLPNVQNALLPDTVFSGSSESKRLDNALLFVNKIFETVFHVTTKIIDASKTYFNDSIYQQQNLSPHIALYLAFIHLYGIEQKELNQLPAKLLDFYYKEVLKIKPKKAVPDQSIVLFELTKGFENFKVNKGTKLLAGKDKQKKELVYTTDKDIVVNKARVSSLKTVVIQKQNSFITHYLGKTIKVNEVFTDPDSILPGFSWKPFGTHQQGSAFDIGFAIASNQLYLAKGERTINIIFETETDLNIPGGDVVNKDILEVLFTGEKGWISSKNIHNKSANEAVRINHLSKTEARRLELNCTIPIAQPSAVIAFDPEIHTGLFNTSSPVIQVLLHLPLPGAEEDPGVYKLKLGQANYLFSVSIVNVTIKVQVGSFDLQKANFDGVRDLVLENHETVLEPHKPFYPFTSLPKVGSSFYIGCKDLYYKDIQKLTVNMEWMLPDNFNTYYDNYFPPYNSNKFMASLSILRDQFWTEIRDVSIIDRNAVQPALRSINVPLVSSEGQTVPDNENEVSKFDLSKKNGTIKLKLNYPDFGHEIYAQLITSVVMEKASSKSKTDFNSLIKKELDDSVISIKMPPPGDTNNRIPNVMNVLRLPNISQQQLRVSIIGPIEDTLIRFNEIPASSSDMQQQMSPEATTLINDTNLISRILRFLKRVKLINTTVHYDRDKDSIDEVVESLSDRVNRRANFMLPTDREMITLIFNEVRNAISRLVLKTADKIIEIKTTRIPNEQEVMDIVTKEVEDANVVINDIVAKKIATLLSANDVPPKPYTPLINTIALSYESEKTLYQGDDQFFHILPFGVAETNPFARLRARRKIDRSLIVDTHQLFSSAIVAAPGPVMIPSGILFIGIKDIAPNENLTLLFQVDQTTRTTDKKPSKVRWCYLQNNNWLNFEHNDIITDSTYGLQATGILEIAIPEQITNRYTHFDEKGLFWLCATVEKETESFPNIIDIKTQAVSVTFEDRQNDPMHLALPLPMGKINKLAEGLPGIKSVQHPVPSFNGKIEERETEYNIRVSERLRHKSRAINNWDYERLVLEQFPFVYKVKCLNNYYSGRFLPRHVTIIPIVSSKNRTMTGTGLAEIPKASYVELKSIEDFLKQRSSPFANIHVVNPQPEYVIVNCKVRFRSGVNKGFHLRKLNEDIKRFLTPWAVETDKISFSTKVYASTIISFIDKLEYVDFVADLSMNQYAIEEDGSLKYARLANQMISLTETQISSAHAILVSAHDHKIEII